MPRMTYRGPGLKVSTADYTADITSRTCLARLAAVGTTYLVMAPQEGEELFSSDRASDFVVYAIPEGPTTDSVGLEGKFPNYAMALNHATSRVMHMILAETA